MESERQVILHPYEVTDQITVINIEIAHFQEIAIASLSGEIDSRTSGLVQERLLPLVKPDCKLLLNMQGVSYLSSAGLRTLLLLYRQITHQNGQVALTGLSEMLYDMMAITGFLDFFTAYATEAEGLAVLSSS